MKFVPCEGGWHLVEDMPSGESRIVAHLRSDVEILALSQFCSYYSKESSKVPEHFSFPYQDCQYRVTPLGGPGEKLRLLIAGSDGTHASVETELVLALH